MSFRVVWKPEAENELTRIWLGSRVRWRVTEAAASIERELERNPQAIGESREEGFRVVFAPPLGVRCHIDETERLVVIVELWEMGR